MTMPESLFRGRHQGSLLTGRKTILSSLKPLRTVGIILIYGIQQVTYLTTAHSKMDRPLTVIIEGELY